MFLVKKMTLLWQIEMNIGVSYDFIIESQDALGIEVCDKKNKSIIEIERSKKGIYNFSLIPEKKDMLKICLIKAKDAITTSSDIIFSYKIK